MVCFRSVDFGGHAQDSQYAPCIFVDNPRIDRQVLGRLHTKEVISHFFLQLGSQDSVQELFRRTTCVWQTMLEKNGLRLAADIFENYGIDSETDLSVLDQDDFSKLASRGLKPLHAKKIELWCESVRERAENMLTSSLNAPASSALLSSEELNVVTPAAHSVGAEELECESVSDNESERDGEEKVLRDQGMISSFFLGID